MVSCYCVKKQVCLPVNEQHICSFCFSALRALSYHLQLGFCYLDLRILPPGLMNPELGNVDFENAQVGSTKTQTCGLKF